MEDSTTTDTEKNKKLKTYSFTRNIPNNTKKEEIIEKNAQKNSGNILNLTLTLYDK